MGRGTECHSGHAGRDRLSPAARVRIPAVNGWEARTRSHKASPELRFDRELRPFRTEFRSGITNA
jgi:hypothetical protein